MRALLSFRNLGLFLLFPSALLTIPAARAQVPERINVQGRLVDNGTLVNTDAQMVFGLYPVALNGAPLYQETQTVTVVDGLYAASLGASNAVPGALHSALVHSPLYLQITIGGVDLQPRERIDSVAYARLAAGVEAGAITSSGLADGIVISNLQVAGSFAPADGQMVELGSSGTPWAGLHVGNDHVDLSLSPVTRYTGHGSVGHDQEISATAGGFGGGVAGFDLFGQAVCRLGDLDGDGVEDIAVGAPRHDDFWQETGGIWILFLNADGTVKAEQKIGRSSGGLTGTLYENDHFGDALTRLGDLDGDGVEDLAVGVPGDDDGVGNAGAVYVLFLNTNGTVKAEQKISAAEGGFAGVLDYGDAFGTAASSLGDLDGDGVGDLAVGAGWDDDGGGYNPGAVWILFLQTNGTVKSHQKISSIEGDFTGHLDNYDQFGESVAGLGDLDGDGVEDVAVGALYDDDGGSDQGAAWVLFLTTNGTVKGQVKISETRGGFSGTLEIDDAFGSSVGSIGDIDGDGVGDLAVGAPRDDDGDLDTGAVWILYLQTNGTVKGHQKISATEGGFAPAAVDVNWIGSSVGSLGDFDGDGILDLVVGALDAVYILQCTAAADSFVEMSSSHGFGFATGTGDTRRVTITDAGWVGVATDQPEHELEVDGAVGAAAVAVDNGHVAAAFAPVTHMVTDGTVGGYQKISDTAGQFSGTLQDEVLFGNGVARIGDLDGDGMPELLVGAPEDDEGGAVVHGAVWVLFLNPDGTVSRHQKISPTSGGFTGVLQDDRFGSAVTGLGDLDGDGIRDVAVGAPHDGDGGLDHGAVWVLFLNADGTVKGHQKISDTAGGFTGGLGSDLFGSAVAGLGDVDGDGVADLAVGAEGDNDGGTQNGAVWILFLNADGTVKGHQKIAESTGGFYYGLDEFDHFGSSVCAMGDIDGNGVTDIAVGTPDDDDGGTKRGKVYILQLHADGTVKGISYISGLSFGFQGVLDDEDQFGSSVAGPGDLDGDGVLDLVVGALGDDDGEMDAGAVWLLFLHRNGGLKSFQKISSTNGLFLGQFDAGDRFGASLCSLGDLNGDGMGDWVVGAPFDDDGGVDRGAAWVVFPYRSDESAVEIASSHGLRLATGEDGEDRLVITEDGSVGIGTLSPRGALQIAGNEVRIGDGGTIDHAFEDGDLYVEDDLEVDGDAWVQGTVTAGQFVGDAGGLTNLVLADDSVTGATIDNGTIRNADISSTANISPTKITGTAATLTGNQVFDLGTLAIESKNDRVGVGVVQPEATLHVSNASTNPSFRVDGNPDDYSLLVTHEGNVGIHTDEPVVPLDVRGGGAIHGLQVLGTETGRVMITGHPTVAGGSGELLLAEDHDGSYGILVRYNGSSNLLEVLGKVDTTRYGPHLVVRRDTSQVGIGRTPTANALEVEGDASKTTAGDWAANSDATIKTDVRELEQALDTIDRLRPVRFRYTEAYREAHPSIEDRDYYNFIAQEFREVFPESVRDDGSGLLQVDAYNVRPYLVRAVQELRAENRELRTRLAELEQRLDGIHDSEQQPGD